MSGPVLAILVLTLVHFAAFGLLFWHLAGRELFATFRIGRDDDGGRPRRDAPPPPTPPPLPDAAPAPVRLREPGRLADGYPRPSRRPEHVPGEEPAHAPIGAN